MTAMVAVSMFRNNVGTGNTGLHDTDFSKHYWDEVYGQPATMDGVFNAGIHADYLHTLFTLDAIEINSVVDIGFGLGYLFDSVLKRFKPYRAVGIEPSAYAFERGQQVIKAPARTRLKLMPMDVATWCSTPRKPQRFDLGICTSVLQYLSDAQIEDILPVLSERVKFLYFTVPTDVEVRRMAADYNFDDKYAGRRSRLKYLKMLAPHFTVVSNRLLESKYHYDETNSRFSELLYRY